VSLSGLLKPIGGVRVLLHLFLTSSRDRESGQPEAQAALLQNNITAVRIDQKDKMPQHR
jgi:hypothetical protein